MLIRLDPYLLFSGTLGPNSDPFDQFHDGKLWDALKRSYLVESTKPEDTAEEGGPETGGLKRFTLDTAIEDEGSGLSVGQRSLVSLPRVLVKDTKVSILDEDAGAVKFRF